MSNYYLTQVIPDYNPEQVDHNTEGNMVFPINDLQGVPVKIKQTETPFNEFSCSNPLPINYKSSQKEWKGPNGNKEAYKEFQCLQQNYHKANKIQQTIIEERKWEGLITCYKKIWNELQRRAKIGINYAIFLVYNEEPLCVERLEKLLRLDSFTVIRLPCKGIETERLYIAFDIHCV